MAGYEPPSFSLGLDLGIDSELQVSFEEFPVQIPASDPVTNGPANGDEAFLPEVMDSDPETVPEPPRILKRLRRGPPTTKTPSFRLLQESQQSCGAVDDEIEEFSSQDEGFLRDAYPPSQHQSVCSSSKIPLHGCGVLTTESSSQMKARKRKQVSDNPASMSLETSRNASMFPKLTISPLRRFQLLDSDSDDPSGHDNLSREVHKTGPCSTEQQSKPHSPAILSEQKLNVSGSMSQNEDLWKDFCPKKNVCIPTPALDEVFEEYFQSLKDKNLNWKLRSNVCTSNKEARQEHTRSSQNDEQVWNSEDPLPPVHRYFFHDDPKIQKLVRNRLPNFSPLGIIKNRGHQQPNASVIDYMRQFNHEETSKQLATRKTSFEKSSRSGRTKSDVSNKDELLASEGWMDPKVISTFGKGKISKQKATRKINVENRSTKGRNNSKRSKKSNNGEGLNTPGSWVDRKSSISTPNDAGKRPVHANGQSAGHWFTTPEGRRVYVTRGGQELTGRSAYSHYRKESGAGFRKSKKKTSAKKRND
ncbi:uncharacterized protein LOC121236438 isoform X1 [Juglans microcarpa x Juglans regia]|uniref:uncharacterized protein LOC121236438 isoform X1 n=1 Tax=Juglans microcarpa x Juglans regia TaxID=2249226 RepID=UPI001B7DF70E|nr:uncharacterized protein LOC121236438 isoform X1 [Juglans microcarpa x Juglans regia]